jgi:hypothetical protein
MMERSDKLTPRDRMMMRVLRHAPWLSFLLAALPAPIIFFLLYLTSATIEGAVTLIFLTLASLFVGSLVGIPAAGIKGCASGWRRTASRLTSWTGSCLN